MSVRYYEFGRIVGGQTSGGGTIIPAEALYGPDNPFVGVLAAGNTTIAFDNPTKGVSVRCTHDLQSLEYSFDGGLTWLLLGPYGETKEFVSITSLLLRNAGPIGTTYEVVGILTE